MFVKCCDFFSSVSWYIILDILIIMLLFHFSIYSIMWLLYCSSLLSLLLSLDVSVSGWWGGRYWWVRAIAAGGRVVGGERFWKRSYLTSVS